MSKESKDEMLPAPLMKGAGDIFGERQGINGEKINQKTIQALLMRTTTYF